MRSGSPVSRLSCKECAEYPINLVSRSYPTARFHGSASVNSSAGGDFYFLTIYFAVYLQGEAGIDRFSSKTGVDPLARLRVALSNFAFFPLSIFFGHRFLEGMEETAIPA